MTTPLTWKILSVEVPASAYMVGIARVDCKLTVALGPIMMTGLSLVEYPDGTNVVWFPKARGERIVIRDAAARHELTALALSAYRRATSRAPADPPPAPAPRQELAGDPERNSRAA